MSVGSLPKRAHSWSVGRRPLEHKRTKKAGAGKSASKNQYKPKKAEKQVSSSKSGLAIKRVNTVKPSKAIDCTSIKNRLSRKRYEQLRSLIGKRRTNNSKNRQALNQAKESTPSKAGERKNDISRTRDKKHMRVRTLIRNCLLYTSPSPRD